MRGHLRQRGTRWCIVVDLPPDPATGKRRQKWYSGYRNKTTARKDLNRILGELQAGTHQVASRLLLHEYLDQWLATAVKPPGCRPATYRTYQSLVETHLKPGLGAVPLARLKALQVQEFLNACRAKASTKGGKPLAPATVSLIYQVLFRALAQAVRWELIPRNVLEYVDAPTVPRRKRPKLEPVDLARLLADLAGTWLELPTLLALATGCRRSEILGLQWPDVNLETGVLTIERQLCDVHAGVPTYGPPKSAAGEREFTLPPLIVERLRFHRTTQARRRWELGPGWTEHRLVVCAENGAPIRPSYLTEQWPRRARALGLDMTFHDLRHASASFLGLQGVALKTVSDRLGHSNIKTTADLYTHTLTAQDQHAAAALEIVLRAALNPPESPSNSAAC